MGKGLDEQELNKKLAEQAGYYGTPEQSVRMDDEALAGKNKKLAEWAGFKFVDKELTYMGVPGGILKSYWVYPDKREWSLPNFLESLDACFKWLPFTFDTLWIIRNPDKTQYCWGFARGQSNDVICWSKELPIEDCLSPIADHQALALCLAIEKKIDGGDKR